MHQDHKYRWVFGPVSGNVHAASEYAMSTEYPMVVDGFALAYCVFNAHQLRAARLDTRLTILQSIHSHESIPDHVADHHGKHGVARGMRLHDALVALSAHHSNFEPAE